MTTGRIEKEKDMPHIIRFNGGAQAGHGVVTPDGRSHIFAQFGSGTFVPDVHTHLSEHFVLHPLRMLVEETYLQTQGITDAFERTTIDSRALVITPFHEIANRLREYARGENRHGSCGIGVGETVKDSVEENRDCIILVGDLAIAGLSSMLRKVQWTKKEQLYHEGVLQACWNMKEAEEDIKLLLSEQTVPDFIHALAPFLERARIVKYDWIKKLFNDANEAWLLTDLFYGDQGKGTTVDFLVRHCAKNAIIFEPAQGVLLDEWRGFHPYTTWSTCTLRYADAMLARYKFVGKTRKLGIVRAYGTRHGAGPFVTEDAGLTERLPDPPSAAAKWQGQFRVGWFDAVAVRYAIQCVGQLDGLVITCLDRLADEPEWKICTSYDMGRDIPLGPFTNLNYQGLLTHRLFDTKPVYEVSTHAASQSARVAEHLATIERELGLPVWITSNGPTHEDKKITSYFPPFF